MDSFQWNGAWIDNGVPAWYTEAFSRNEVVHVGPCWGPTDHAIIDTLDGGVVLRKGDWVSRDADGKIIRLDDASGSVYQVDIPS